MATKKLPTKRKQPSQARSQATVDAILEATAQILISDGYDKATTNRIAKIAGVSIGSLYQYFPNKESLVTALAERHVAQQISSLHGLTQELQNLPLKQAIAHTVAGLVRSHAAAPDLHNVLLTQVIHLGQPFMQKAQKSAESIIVAFLRSRQEEIVPTDLDLAAFVLVSAVEGVIHRSSLTQNHGGNPEHLIQEISILVLRYLTKKTTTT